MLSRVLPNTFHAAHSIHRAIRIEWLALLAAAMVSPVAASGGLSAGHVVIAPGDIGRVEIRLQHDGKLSGFQGRLYVDEGSLRRPAFGWVDGTSAGLCVVTVSGGVDIDVAVAPLAGGNSTLICTIPISAAGVTRRTVELRLGGACQDEFGVALPCELANGSVRIDGIAPVPERSLAIVPRLGADVPTRDQILAFDYSDANRAPPLASLAAPRPESVAPLLSSWSSPLKQATAPNDAVAALLRAVRVTYVDEPQWRQGLQATRADAAIQEVLPRAVNATASVYPANPRAGQPFALWLTSSAHCNFFVAAHHDDRHLSLSADRIVVDVRYRSDPCTIRPPGLSHVLLNLPGLPAGDYTLDVVPRDWQSGDELALAPHPQLAITVGGAASADAVTVPVLDSRYAFVLALGLFVIACRRWRD